MSDEYLDGIRTRSGPIDVHYTYTPQEEAARRELIALIEAEKAEFLRRIEPYVQRLAAIPGKPHYMIPTSLR